MQSVTTVPLILGLMLLHGLLNHSVIRLDVGLDSLSFLHHCTNEKSVSI